MSWYKKEKKEVVAFKGNKKIIEPAILVNQVAATAHTEHQSTKVLTHLIKHPIVSEKAIRLQSQGQYTFKVTPGTSKIILKKEVENLYKVKVVKVTSVKLPKKIIVNKGKHGQRSIRKYMRVHLQSGQTINLGQV
ncbi:MAG: 50S ribosomal protein L23 [Patescibacteria group bacterium]